MKRLGIALALALAPTSCFAALSAAVVWDVRTAGATTNGGAFKSGATGTDWSTYDNKNASGCTSCGSSSADLSVTDGVTAGTTTITSATANFGTTIVGNVIYVSGGTGGITGDWYEVTARASTTSITVDRSTGLTTGTGVTLNIGGGISTLTTILSKVVAGNKIYIKNGTYAETLDTAVAGGAGTPIRWIGYATTHGDNPTGSTRPLIDGASTRSWAILADQQGNEFSYIRMTGATIDNFRVTQTSFGLYLTSYSAASDGFQQDAGHMVCIACEAYSNTSAGFNQIYRCYGCYSHDNTGVGYYVGNADTATFFLSIADSNSSHGFQAASSAGLAAFGCTSYGNTGASTDGFLVSSSTVWISYIYSSISASNGKYGIEQSSSSASLVIDDYNGVYGNSTAAYSVAVAGAHSVTTDPTFTNAASGDFSIGTNYKAAGWPGVFPGATSTGYLDIGAVQRQEAGGGLMRQPSLRGGIVQ